MNNDATEPSYKTLQELEDALSPGVRVFNGDFPQEEIEQFISTVLPLLQGEDCFVNTQNELYVDVFEGFSDENLPLMRYESACRGGVHIWKKSIENEKWNIEKMEAELEWNEEILPWTIIEYWFDGQHFLLEDEKWISQTSDLSSLPYTLYEYDERINELIELLLNKDVIAKTTGQKGGMLGDHYVLIFPEGEALESVSFSMKNESALRNVSIIYRSGNYLYFEVGHASERFDYYYDYYYYNIKATG